MNDYCKRAVAFIDGISWWAVAAMWMAIGVVTCVGMWLSK